MKNQHDLTVRTHHNGRIQHCMLHIHIYTTKPQKPTFISMESQLELYILLALMCPFLRPMTQPKRQWNPSKHHPFETVRITGPGHAVSVFHYRLWFFGSWVVVKYIGWQHDTVKAVTMLISSKAERPAFLGSSQNILLLVNRRSGLTPILK